MRFAFPFIFTLLSIFCFKGKAHSNLVKADTIYFSFSEKELQKTFVINQELNDKRPNPILHWLTKKQKKNKRIMAAILAFPFPFGIVGLHRIYLGTAPYVPVVYIASLGGIFGILPFIDFCVIVLDKDFDRYNNNKKVFMWIND